MNQKKKTNSIRTTMRVLHRYIGFFMAGIMAIYSISGILLVYRDTDFLKKELVIEKKLEPQLLEKALGKELKIKNFEVEKQEGDFLIFKQGKYNSKTGEAKYTKKELPTLLKKMTNLHKTESKDKWAPLSVLFGASLFFFVISSFWMFNTKTKAFKRGIIYTAAGLVLSVILVWIS
ncbi:hypothetical protein [Frigoriflavimonas asaccharolytica]|uniref:PepSY-associated transmembrane protein n=1 Tax=Frigoriflavimonas asaccharolytica TaxID=2735899 RepID=A0A8J8G544_9FLAO|nr:hypothetical protein [Frigoriflavimonas asaccharolytica]NRS91313.1 hypothetical protein [Frigoriflavimonas asaccharolytica]